MCAAVKLLVNFHTMTIYCINIHIVVSGENTTICPNQSDYSVIINRLINQCTIIRDISRHIIAGCVISVGIFRANYRIDNIYNIGTIHRIRPVMRHIRRWRRRANRSSVIRNRRRHGMSDMMVVMMSVSVRFWRRRSCRSSCIRIVCVRICRANSVVVSVISGRHTA